MEDVEIMENKMNKELCFGLPSMLSTASMVKNLPALVVNQQHNIVSIISYESIVKVGF